MFKLFASLIGCSVRLGQHVESGEKVAMKILFKAHGTKAVLSDKQIRGEVEVMSVRI